MPAWAVFPYDGSAYRYDAETLRRLWPRLHAGDAEPLPRDEALLAAWALLHAGEFEQAFHAGQRLGAAGAYLVNRAQAVHATYLETHEASRLAQWAEIARRAQNQLAETPDDPNALFMLAYGLGRHGQTQSVARAIAQGLGARVRAALEKTRALRPRHADAHVGLGTFQAEVVDKLGRLLARAHGASRGGCIAMFERALQLDPTSAIARIEYADALVLLDGDAQLDASERLYAQAADCEPMDAVERLHVERARTELAEF